jgi:hypothetical protein
MNRLLPDRSFMRDGTQMLWQELTGESIRDQAFWKAYRKHVERRNPAVPGKIFGFPSGETISKDDAEASIEAARAMTNYLLATFLERVMGELTTGDGGRMAEEDQWRALRVISPRPATPASERMARAVTQMREERGLSVDDLAAVESP